MAKLCSLVLVDADHHPAFQTLLSDLSLSLQTLDALYTTSSPYPAPANLTAVPNLNTQHWEPPNAHNLNLQPTQNRWVAPHLDSDHSIHSQVDTYGISQPLKSNLDNIRRLGSRHSTRHNFWLLRPDPGRHRLLPPGCPRVPGQR